MVVGAFPAAKLLTLLIRQISKPIANYAKEKAKSSPFFRNYICMPPAQFYNWCEVKTKMWVLNLGKPINIPVLNEAMAIELGANLLGEGIIFVVAAGILIAEYARQSSKEAVKEELRKNEVSELNHKIQELYCDLAQQDAHIRELTRIMFDLNTRVVSKPWIKKGTSLPSLPLNNEHKDNDIKRNSLNSVNNKKDLNYLNSQGVFLEALNYVEKEIILQEDFNDTNDSLIEKGLDYLHCHRFLVSNIT